MFSEEWAGLAPEAYWSERRFWSLENLGSVIYSCVTWEQIMFSFLPQLPHLKWVAMISQVTFRCKAWAHNPNTWKMFTVMTFRATYRETSINDTCKSPLVKGRHEKPTHTCFQLCPTPVMTSSFSGNGPIHRPCLFIRPHFSRYRHKLIADLRCISNTYSKKKTWLQYWERISCRR